MSGPITFDVEALDFVKGGGVVTVVTQCARTGTVLMVAQADREAVDRTIATGEMHYRSRTRGLWHKGATSGNVQRVISLTRDCDSDALLARVDCAGPSCHTGAPSCFGDTALGADVVGALDQLIESRRTADDHTPSYTRQLLADRNLRLKKIGEEAAELVVALADGDRDRVAEETADLLYHVLVAVRASGSSWNEVRSALSARNGRPLREHK